MFTFFPKYCRFTFVKSSQDGYDIAIFDNSLEISTNEVTSRWRFIEKFSIFDQYVVLTRDIGIGILSVRLS